MVVVKNSNFVEEIAILSSLSQHYSTIEAKGTRISVETP